MKKYEDKRCPKRRKEESDGTWTQLYDKNDPNRQIFWSSHRDQHKKPRLRKGGDGRGGWQVKDDEEMKWPKGTKKEYKEVWTQLHDKNDTNRKMYWNQSSGEICEYYKIQLMF